MSHRKWTILLTLLLSALFLQGQNDSLLSERNPSKYSITDVYLLTLSQDNGAAGCYLSHSALTAYFDNRFLVKEMMTKGLGAVFRKGQNGFLMDCQHFGYSRYGELSARVGYCCRFGQHIAFGLRFQYLMMHSSENQCVHSISFDLSAYATIGKNIGLGFAVMNPARLKVGITGKNVLPIRLQFDINYKIGKQILLFARVEKELKSAFCIEAGAAYHLKVLYITVAAGFPKPKFSVNMQIACGRWLLGVSSQYLLKAGFVPMASVVCVL